MCELKSAAEYLARVLSFIFLICTVTCNAVMGQIQLNPDLEKAETLRYKDTDSSIYYYKKGIKRFKTDRDTLNVINGLLMLSSLYAHNVDYGNAYDGYWEALLLADSSSDEFSKSKVYQQLGWLYSFYSRTDEAIKYFTLSLEIKKKLNSKNKISDNFVRSDYFSLVNLYRMNGDMKMARIYLDSCKLLQKPNEIPKSYFIESEEAYFKAQNGDFDSSLEKLFEARDFFKEENPAYLVIIDYLIGSVYDMLGDLKNSVEYYKSSLKFSEEYNSHANYRLIVREALSDTYFKLNDFENAYLQSKQAYALNERIFGKESKNNKHLFDIKDQYRLQEEKEKELIREQRITNLENEKKLLNLRFALMAVVIVSLLVSGYLLIRNVRRKHKIEKNAIAEKRKIERQKASEILELKNKELTSSALQLIEKDQFIEKLKVSISGNTSVDVKKIHRMLKTIQGTPGSNWKQFESRFTAINQSFYESIKENFGKLGQTDLKICALIKLNFSSKEMSSLLGISVESVHTSRHRLRKKLKLSRSENLAEFISNF